MFDIRDDWPIVLMVGILLLLIAGLVWGCIYTLTTGAEKACRNTGTAMDVNWQWEFWGGCFLEVEPGKWMPRDAYLGLEKVER